MKSHPVFVGIANALLPGIGYVLIDERKVFGWLLLLGSISCLILAFVEPVFLSETFFVSKTLAGKVLETIWYTSFVIAYGYDAYSIAKHKRQSQLPLVITDTPHS